jgi:hypothetical protein
VKSRLANVFYNSFERCVGVSLTSVNFKVISAENILLDFWLRKL